MQTPHPSVSAVASASFESWHLLKVTVSKESVLNEFNGLSMNTPPPNPSEEMQLVKDVCLISTSLFAVSVQQIAAPFPLVNVSPSNLH